MIEDCTVPYSVCLPSAAELLPVSAGPSAASHSVLGPAASADWLNNHIR